VRRCERSSTFDSPHVDQQPLLHIDGRAQRGRRRTQRRQYAPQNDDARRDGADGDDPSLARL
jgi:hypothetical protein